MKEIGQELFQSKNHRESLTGISISTSIGNVYYLHNKIIKMIVVLFFHVFFTDEIWVKKIKKKRNESRSESSK